MKKQSGYIAVILLLGVALIALAGAIAYRADWHFFDNFQKEIINPVLTKVTNTTGKSISAPIATFQPYPTTPSDRSLKAAAWSYTHMTKSEVNTMIKNNSTLAGNSDSEIVNNMALYLDKSPATLAIVEADMQKSNTESSRPIINNPAPIIQQQTSPKHCTSTSVGDYTYTNCY